MSGDQRGKQGLSSEGPCSHARKLSYPRIMGAFPLDGRA